MVLGGHNSSPGPRRAARGFWRGVFGTWQQPPSLHADAVSQDRPRSHQYTDPVQQRPFSLGFQLPGPAQPLVLPQRSEPGAVLHGTKEQSRRGGAGQGGSFQILSGDHSEHICSVETEACRLQAPQPPLPAAPHTARHQQTLWLPRAATTPKASAAVHPGLPLQSMRGGGGLVGSPRVFFSGWILKMTWSGCSVPVNHRSAAAADGGQSWKTMNTFAADVSPASAWFQTLLFVEYLTDPRLTSSLRYCSPAYHL